MGTVRTMYYLRLSIVIGFAALFSACATKTSIPSSLYFGGFVGTWVGKLEPSNAYEYPFGPSQKNGLLIKLDIKGSKKISSKSKGSKSEGSKPEITNIEASDIDVYIFKNSVWMPVKKGLFKIVTNKTNAIIYAFDSSEDVLNQSGNGGWVETFNLSLTLKDDHSLYAVFTSVVNNYITSDQKRQEKSYLVSYMGVLDDIGHNWMKFKNEPWAK